MANKGFILQRIRIFAGREVDPNIDEQVNEILKDKFEIMLPQRRSMNESLAASTSDHEILGLILKYREMG